MLLLSAAAALPARELPLSLEREVPPAWELKEWVDRFCREDMGGRRGVSPGAALAAKTVARMFCLAGLRPGGPGGSYYQPFPVALPGDRGRCRNVLGLLPGRRPGAVILCAHYDHIGRGGGQSRRPGDGRIHPGANDNASGLAVLLGLARAFGRRPDRLGRTLLFAAWGAEELGALGSRWWVDHPTLPLEQVTFLVNLDMVGRCRGRLLAAGAASARGLERELAGLAGGLEVVPIALSFGGSDHQVFLDRGIPALHLFTGADTTYHTPADRPDRILPAGLRRVALFTGRLALHLARRPLPYAFDPAGRGGMAGVKPPAGPRPAFGSIPDFSQTRGGYRLAGVKPGSPAARAGLRRGDLMIAFGGRPLDTFRDYVAALFAHKPGQVVAVEVVREGRRMEVEVELGTAPPRGAGGKVHPGRRK